MAVKKCLICNSSLRRRADAKTCSVRCRKRLSLVRGNLIATDAMLQYRGGDIQRTERAGITHLRPKEQPTGKVSLSRVTPNPLISQPVAPVSRKKRLGGLKKGLMLLIFGLFGVLSLLLSAAPQKAAAANTSSNLNFQARLFTNTGAVVPDGLYNIQFKIYDGGTAGGPSGTGQANSGTGGTYLWTESYYDTNGVTAGNDFRVSVINGYFSVNMGSQTAFSGINWDQELWLTMNIGGTTQTATPTYDGEMTNSNARIKLTGVPYAFSAGQLAATSGANRGTLSFSTVATNPAILLPDASGTICLQASASCGFATSTGSGSYIQNGTTLQNPGNFNIQSAAAGSIGAIIHANASQSVDIFDVDDSSTNVYLGVSSNGSLSVSPAAAGTITLGTATQTGIITIGQTTTGTTATVNILSAAGTASTQTINIGAGTSTTSGGKVVNIATGVPGTSTTNQINIGNGGTTTGTVAIIIGSNGAAAHTTLIQGGNGTGTGSAAIKIQPAAAGDIYIGTTTATGTIIIGSSSSANPVQIANGSGASAVSIANVQNGGSVAIGAGFTTGTFAVGGTATTGIITIGQATTATTSTVNISSAAGTASTQTIEIGGGTSTTSGGKVVNIANGAPGTGTTNTVAIGTGGSTTGTVGITIGSATAAAHTLLLQGGNGTGASAAIKIQPNVAGDILIGAAAATGTFTLGSSSSANNILIANGAGASAVSIANVQNGGSVAIGAGFTTGTFTVGGAATTGIITIGQTTTGTTGTVNILSAAGTASTQTINIGAGTSTTSGGKIVNIATGIPGASTTNQVNIGNGGTTTGTVAVIIGSVGAAGHTTLIQGGNGATAIQLQAAGSGVISIGNNAVANTVQIGINGTNTGNTQTINIGNQGSAGTATIVIGAGSGATGGTTTIQSKGALTLGNGVSSSIVLDTAAAGTITIGGTNGTTTVGRAGAALVLNGSNFSVDSSGNVTASGTYNTNTFNSSTLQFGAAGTATVDSASGQALQIGTGANAHNVTVGNTTSTSTLTLQAGTGGINLGTAALSNTIQIGTTSVNTGNTQSINIGTTNSAGTTNVIVGTNSGATAGTTTIQAKTSLVLTSPNFGVNSSGNVTASGTYNTNTFNSSTLQFGAAGTATVDSASGQALQIGTGANAHNITVGNMTSTSALNLQGGTGNINLNVPAGGGVRIAASAAPTVDQFNITNAGQAVTTAGVNNLSLNFLGGAGAIEAGAQRIDLTPGSTSGSVWNGVRFVANATGPATGVTETAYKIEAPTSSYAGTFNGINFIAPSTGPASGGALNAINIGSIGTPGAATETAINIGAGWDAGVSILSGGNLIKATSTSALAVQNASAVNMLSVDSSGNTVQVGSSTTDATAISFVLDSYNNATDPTGVAGAMYYNTSLNAFRCFQNGAWVNCAGSGGSGVNTVGTYSSSNHYSDGANITGSVITLGSADATHPGLIDTGAQTFAGDKTFKSTTNSTTAFQVQNSAGSQFLDVDTLTTANAIGDGDIENTIANWAGENSATVAQTSTQAWQGSNSLAVTLGTNSAGGAKYTYALSADTTYALSMYVKASSAALVTSKVMMGWSENGSTDNACLLNASGNSFPSLVSTVNWTRLTCTFTTSDATPSGTYVFVQKSGDATNYNLYVDGLQIEPYANLMSSNPGFETATSPPPAPWSTTGTVTFTRTTTAGQFTSGAAAASVAGTATLSGAKYAVSLNSNTTYTLQMYAKASGSNITTIEMGRSEDGSTFTSCMSGQTITTSAFTLLRCTFTTGTTSGSPFVYIRYTATGSATFFLDHADLWAGSYPAPKAFQQGQITLNGNIDSPVLFKNQSDSTSAFQIQNSSGTGLFNVDTTNNNVQIGSTNNGGLGSWTRSQFGFGARYGGVTGAYNGYFYYGGGQASTTPSTTVEYGRITPDGDIVDGGSTNSLATAEAYSASVVVGGYMYVIGGTTNNTTSGSNVVQYARLNGAAGTGTWNTTTVLPAALYGATAVTSNGYIYVMGGSTGSNSAVTTTYSAKVNSDGTIGSWTTFSGAQLLPAARFNGTSVISNGIIYYIGGLDTSGVAQSIVYESTLASDNTISGWITASPLPQPRERAAAVVTNGYVYVMGGNNSGAANTIYYNKVDNQGGSAPGTWVQNTINLPASLHSASAFAYNGYVYYIDGASAGIGTSISYFASTARLQVGVNLDLVGLQHQGEPFEETASDPIAGTTGGSITAGDITAFGNLQVTGDTSLGSADVQGNIRSGGSVLFQNAVNTGTAFQVQSSTGVAEITADTTNNKIQIGNATTDATAVILILDKYNNATDPTEVDGAMYYNSALAGFRCGFGGYWNSCSLDNIQTTYNFEDDFLGGGTTDGTIGNLNWGLGNGGTAMALSYNPGGTPFLTGHDHPGWLVMSSATNGAISIIREKTTNSAQLQAGDDFKSTVYIGTPGNTRAMAGFANWPTTPVTNQEPNAGSSSGVWWEANPTGNANWQYCYANNNTATCTAGSTTVASGNPFQMEIRVISTTAVDFIENGTVHHVTGASIDLGGTNKLTPFVSYNNVSAGAARSLNIDYVQWSGFISTAGGR